jgi:hypothetical protein
MAPPRYRRPDRGQEDPLEYEIAREKAAALGRLGRGLERALAELAAFDASWAASASPQEPGPEASQRRAARAALLDAAGHALWLFMVQREACGLRDARAVMRDYRVPSEVQARAGAFPPKR